MSCSQKSDSFQCRISCIYDLCFGISFSSRGETLRCRMFLFSILFPLKVYEWLSLEHYLVLIVLNLPVITWTNSDTLKKRTSVHTQPCSSSHYSALNQVLDLFKEKVTQIYGRRTDAHFADMYFLLASFSEMSELLWFIIFLKIFRLLMTSDMENLGFRHWNLFKL